MATSVPRLLDQHRDRTRPHDYSIRTDGVCVDWARQSFVPLRGRRAGRKVARRIDVLREPMRSDEPVGKRPMGFAPAPD